MWWSLWQLFSPESKTISSSFMENIYIFIIFYHLITFEPRIFEVWKGKNLCPLGVKSESCQCHRFREKVPVSHQYYFLPKNTVRSMYKVLQVRRQRTAQSVSRPCLVFRIFRKIVSVVCLPGFCPEFSKNAVLCLSLRSDKAETELSGLSVSRFKLSDELPRDWPYAKRKLDSNQSLMAKTLLRIYTQA